jgi:hypothetical protein
LGTATAALVCLFVISEVISEVISGIAFLKTSVRFSVFAVPFSILEIALLSPFSESEVLIVD